MQRIVKFFLKWSLIAEGTAVHDPEHFHNGKDEGSVEENRIKMI